MKENEKEDIEAKNENVTSINLNAWTFFFTVDRSRKKSFLVFKIFLTFFLVLEIAFLLLHFAVL